MLTNATPAYGTFLKMGDGATPETFSTVAEVNDLDLPEIKANYEDVTNHDSAGWEESIPTLLSGGEVGFKVNWLPTHATQNETTGLLYATLNRVKKNWKIVLPNNVKTFSFAAYVSVKPSAKVKGALEADIKLKITGPVTVA